MNIKKISGIFHADLDNIHHAAFWLGFFSVLSALLGMFRDRLLAGTFGATRTLDIYYSAFRVPDFIYTFMLLFTASTAIIPIFLKKHGEKKENAEELLGSLILFFSCAVLILSFAAFFLMPYATRIFFPGFAEEEAVSTIFLSRILLFSPIFLGLSNIFSSATQSFRRFFVYGLSPVFYNVGIILGVGVFYKLIGLGGLAWGVALGAFLHMAVQIPALGSIGVFPTFKKIFGEDVRQIAALSLPRTLGLGITQLTTIILTGIASFFSQGSIAVFNLALNLEYIPVTVVGLSYSVAAFPNLVAYSIKKAKDEFAEHFSTAIRHIIFWTVPASILILVLRAQIVRVILGSGEFTWSDTRLTAAALFILSLAIIFQSIFMLLVRTFYAEGESWRPLVINAASSFITIGAAIWLTQHLSLTKGAGFASFVGWALRVSDIPDIRIMALPFGILVGSLFNFIFLIFSFRAIFGWLPMARVLRAFLESVFAGATGGLIAYLGLNIFSRVFDLHTFIGVFSQGLLSGLFGVAAVAVGFWILGSREFFEVLNSARGLFLEKEKGREDMVPAPEPEKLL